MTGRITWLDATLWPAKPPDCVVEAPAPTWQVPTAYNCLLLCLRAVNFLDWARFTHSGGLEVHAVQEACGGTAWDGNISLFHWGDAPRKFWIFGAIWWPLVNSGTCKAFMILPSTACPHDNLPPVKLLNQQNNRLRPRASACGITTSFTLIFF